MAAQDVKKHVIDRMKNHMVAPKTCTPDNLREIITDYVTALSCYDEATLSAAWQLIISRWKGSTWPKVAHWVDACKEAQSKAISTKISHELTREDHRREARKYVADRTKQLVNDIVNSRDDYMHVVQMTIRTGEYYDLETDLIIIAHKYLSYEYFFKNNVTKYAVNPLHGKQIYPVVKWDDEQLMAWGSELWTQNPFDAAFERCKLEHVHK